MTREITGLADIVEHFDAVIVDQYGVLHDGQSAFPGAVAVQEALKHRGVPVVVLTNSGKRAKTNSRRLPRIGFPEEFFCAVVSSGDIARNRIADLEPGSAILLVAREGETELVNGLDVRLVAPGNPVDLILFAAVEPLKWDLTAYAKRVAPYARQNIPAHLVNPDLLIAENGQTAFGPGAVAENYARMGGQVEVLGKPAQSMFEAARKAVGKIPPHKALMIGDSPHHDISGAAEAGMKTLLIRSGVQSSLGDAMPDFVMDVLLWK